MEAQQEQQQDVEKPLKVCILQPSYKDTSSIIKDLDTRRDLSQWASPQWEVQHLFLDKAKIVPQLRQAKADVYVNLCGTFYSIHKHLKKR